MGVMMSRAIAQMIRDNAVHEWRTLTEISEDEGISKLALMSECERYLEPIDLRDIEAFDTNGCLES